MWWPGWCSNAICSPLLEIAVAFYWALCCGKHSLSWNCQEKNMHLNLIFQILATALLCVPLLLCTLKLLMLCNFHTVLHMLHFASCYPVHMLYNHSFVPKTVADRIATVMEVDKWQFVMLEEQMWECYQQQINIGFTFIESRALNICKNNTPNHVSVTVSNFCLNKTDCFLDSVLPLTHKLSSSS